MGRAAIEGKGVAKNMTAATAATYPNLIFIFSFPPDNAEKHGSPDPIQEPAPLALHAHEIEVIP